MVSILQILGVLFGLVMLFFTYSYFKRKEFEVGDFVVWLVVWLLFIVATVVPESVKFAFEALNIQGALWFITIGAVAFLTILVFYLHKTVRKMQGKVEKLVTEIALKNAK